MVTEVSDILARVRNFPTIVEAEPVAYEVEVATYDTLPLPLPTPATVQIQGENGACFEGVFSTFGQQLNTSTVFKGKSDAPN